MKRLFPYVLFLTALWVNSGTLVPYATTTPYDVTGKTEGLKIIGDCKYLYNGDHDHYSKVNMMVAGHPPKDWVDSIYLRRWLHPFLLRPFSALFGFEIGGALGNFFWTLLAFFFFVKHIKSRWGEEASKNASWILLFYPGTYYWSGLPYNQAAIVPVSLISYVLLSSWFQKWEKKILKTSETFKYLLGIGLLSCAYEILPFFGCAFLFLLWGLNFKQLALKVQHALVGIFALGLPTLLSLLALAAVVPAKNSNTATYGNIIKSYLSIFQGAANWPSAWNVFSLVKIFFLNILDSQHWTLALFVLLLFLLGLKKSKTRFSVEWALLLSGFILWAFNNLAPEYPGWQMRGLWIARLYQPLFVSLIIVASVYLTQLSRLLRPAMLAIYSLAGAAIIFGPVLGFSNPAGIVHSRFYLHSNEGPEKFKENLEFFGRRPLGICREN